MTITEVAKLLRVHPRTIHRYIRNQGLPAFQPGSGRTAPWRFIRTDVMAWARSCEPFTSDLDLAA